MTAYGGAKRADEIFFAERVDAVFDAHAGISLRQRRRRNADMPHAAMRRRRGETGHIQERAPAHRDQIGVAVNVVPVNLRMDFVDELRGIFGAFTALDD